MTDIHHLGLLGTLPFLSTFAPPLASLGVAWLAVKLMIRFSGFLPLDIPIDRSLHLQPVPRTGGMGICLGVLAAVFLLDTPELYPMMLLGAVLAGVSLLDDFRTLPVLVRLVVHVMVSLAFAFLYAPESLPAWALGMVIFILAWSINLYNFMDGSDGLAAGMAMFGFGAYGLAAWGGGDISLAIVAFSIAAAALSFLASNFHPARIFMGDVGAIPLGFIAGALGCIGYWRGIWPMLFPVIVFSPFIMDASVTLLKRLIQGKKVWQAHNTHYYQRLVGMGLGHRGMALWAFSLMALTVGSALAMLKWPGYMWLLASGWGLFYVGAMLTIDSRIAECAVSPPMDAGRH